MVSSSFIKFYDTPNLAYKENNNSYIIYKKLDKIWLDNMKSFISGGYFQIVGGFSVISLLEIISNII